MAERDKRSAKTASGIKSEELHVSFQGTAEAVRCAINEVRFVEPWTRAAARRIAKQETGVSDAQLDDTLGGPKIRFASEEARLVYRDRCCDRAADMGHPVPNEEDVLNGADDTVRQVGDSLYDAARP